MMLPAVPSKIVHGLQTIVECELSCGQAICENHAAALMVTVAYA